MITSSFGGWEIDDEGAGIGSDEGFLAVSSYGRRWKVK
jgi:hypothetical protein